MSSKLACRPSNVGYRVPPIPAKIEGRKKESPYTPFRDQYCSSKKDADYNHSTSSSQFAAAGIAASLWRIGYLLASVGLEIVKGAGLSSDTLNKGFLEKISPPYQPNVAEQEYFRGIKENLGTLNGIDFLIDHHGLSVESSFKEMVRYILTYQPPPLKQTVVNEALLLDARALTPKLVETLRDPSGRYKLTYEQMRLLIRVVGDEVKKSTAAEQMIMVVDNSVPVSAEQGTMAIRDIDRRQSQTREIRARLKTRLRKSKTAITTSVLNMMLDQLDTSRTLPNEVAISVGGKDIVVDFTKIPEGSRLIEIKRYVRRWQRILPSPMQSWFLPTKRPVSALEKLVEADSHVVHLRNLTGAQLEELIVASNKGEALLARALDPTDETSRGIRKFLYKLTEAPEKTLALQIGSEKPIIAQWGLAEGGNSTPLYVSDAFLASVGPYTFYESKVIKLRRMRRGISEPALLIIDRRGRPGMVTLSEMKNLSLLSGTMEEMHRAGSLPGGEEYLKSFYRFYSDLRRAWHSISWTDGRVAKSINPSTLPYSLEAQANEMARLAPGYELLRSVRQTSGQLQNLKTHLELGKFEYKKMVNNRISEINERYSGFFKTTPLKARFEKSLAILTTAIIEGDAPKVLGARAGIKDAVFEAMEQSGSSRYRGSVKTVAFGEEVRGWLRIAKQGEPALTAEGLEKLTLFRINQGSDPSLELARRLATKGNYPEALSEFGRVSTDPATDVETRATALAELFRVAYLADNVEWMNKALAELEYLVTEGHRLSTNETKIVREAVSLEKAGLISVPTALRNALERKIGIDRAVSMVTEALLGNGIPQLFINNRLQTLSVAAYPELNQMVKTALEGPLKGADKNTLKTLSTYTEAEFERFLEALPISAQEKDSFRTFYMEARGAVRRHGYDPAKLQRHDSVKLLAGQTVEGLELLLSKGQSRTTPTETQPGKMGITGMYAALPKSLSSYRWAHDIKDAATPSMLSLLTFVFAKNSIQTLLPPPTKTWEAVTQGYSIMGSAMLIDHALNETGNYIIKQTAKDAALLEPFTIRTGLSLSKTAGNLGSAIIVWRGLAGASELMGASPETAEWVGLGGMAAAFGGYRPAMKFIAPAVYRDISVLEPLAASIRDRTLVPLYTSSASPALMRYTKALNVAALYYFLADVALGTLDAVVDVSKDDINSSVRNLEYVEFKNDLIQKSFFGEGKNTGFFERSGYTAMAAIDTLIPAAWHKLCGDVTGTDWRKWKKAEIINGVKNRRYEQHYSNALVLLQNSSLALEKSFGITVSRAIWSSSPEPLGAILANLDSNVINSEASEVLGTLGRWEKYTEANLKKDDLHWLFKSGAVKEGKIRDINAITFWMGNRFNTILDQLETSIINVEKNISNIDMADRLALKRARFILGKYRLQLKVIISLYNLQALIHNSTQLPPEATTSTAAPHIS